MPGLSGFSIEVFGFRQRPSGSQHVRKIISGFSASSTRRQAIERFSVGELATHTEDICQLE